ncbi:MAG: hypothetical protein ACJ74O_09590 [Frankiaceae bacterium]
MAAQRIVVCPDGHLFRIDPGPGSVGDLVRSRCPVCAAVVAARVVDSRMLSQEALAEAWRHREDPG